MSSLLAQNSPVESKPTENEDSLEAMLNSLKQIASYYRNIQHIENLLAVLSTQYEIYLFQDDTEASQSIANEMKELIEFYELKESESKIDFLLNGGTTNEQLKLLFGSLLDSPLKNKEDFDALVNEMKAIDAKEEKEKPAEVSEETVVVDLFPIQYFLIDKKRLETFYDILNIENIELKKQLDFFYDNGIIPILNILTEVRKEGPLNGHLESQGIKSWRRIRDIRLALYENKFYRQISK